MEMKNNLASNALVHDNGRFKVPQLCPRKTVNNTTALKNSRPVLGSINNIPQQVNGNCTGKNEIPSKPNLTRKMSFTHVRSKVDSNLNPGVKSVGGVLTRTLRRQESTSSLVNKPTVLQRLGVRTDSKAKFERSAKSCMNLSLKTQENGVLSAETIEKMEMIEAADKLNPLMLVEYKSDLYKYLHSLETKYQLSEDFLAGMQINHKMRATLINWLVDVHLQFKSTLDSLHLTISIMDRFFQKTNNVLKRDIQLIGVTAMIIACKYEEIQIHDVQDYVIMCDDAYTKKEILKMEYTILRTLNFNLSPPLPVHFLRRLSKVGGAEPIHHAMAKYFIELMLLDYNTCYYKPSEISATAICLAFALINEHLIVTPRTVWTPVLQYFSTYQYNDIERIIYKLANIITRTGKSNHRAISNKYSTANMMKVSQRPELESALVKKLAARA